ncbi:MAG: DUF559 domain-containing protein [Clostridiales bacterium]|nr:DUF559 domain-containing protein [Clostridiales bacterium]
MSYREAVEDKIPRERDAKGFDWYYPLCHICGAPVHTWKYVRGTKYVCDGCRDYFREQKKLEQDVGQTEKKEKRLQTAIKRISRVAEIGFYHDAIECVRGKLETPGWFQSTEEIMTALELLRCGVRIHHQVKVYAYSVDFILPDLHVALEIDGRVFHGKDKIRQQEMRDRLIAEKLGEGWQVIRIDTDNINTNVTKLLPVIKAVLRERKKKPSQFTPVHPGSP